jgi:hypothetical protein
LIVQIKVAESSYHLAKVAEIIAIHDRCDI